MDETKIFIELKLNSIELKTTCDKIKEIKKMIDMYCTQLNDQEMEKVNIEREITVLTIELGRISIEKA